QPLFAGLPASGVFREERLKSSVRGLQSSLTRAGTGSQQPLWDRLPTLAMPVLVLAGEQDPKFAALAARLASSIGGNATMALVPSAGHAAHLEQPERTVEILRAWLARHDL